VNEQKILKKVFNMKVKGECPRGRSRSRWEQQVRKDVTQGRKEGHGKILRSSCGKTEIDGDIWLLGNPHEVETS
jgi:hypothetical protein